LQNSTLCPISASGSNFNPRNIQYVPAVEIIAFFVLEHKLPFFKGPAAISRATKVSSARGGEIKLFTKLSRMK
jgi:hypothetical protein